MPDATCTCVFRGNVLHCRLSVILILGNNNGCLTTVDHAVIVCNRLLLTVGRLLSRLRSLWTYTRTSKFVTRMHKEHEHTMVSPDTCVIEASVEEVGV